MNILLNRARTPVALLLTLHVIVASAYAGDWPMWRYGAGRGAAAPDALAETLHLQWVRQLPKPRPAWPTTQSKLQFDVAPQPVVAGHRIFIPSTVTDSLTAFDTVSGKELWRFYTDGPIRFAPVAAKDRVYFTSDDGHLYCLSAAEGRLLWKINGGPTQRAILGNGRLISSWPARGGPVLHDDKIYFAASIWPFMGIFIHAVDATTGEIVWTNSGDGTNWTVHPHNAQSFGTVVPQGHLSVSGNHLIVPGGRSTPAVYDAETGKMRFFHHDHRRGGHFVAAAAHTFFVAGGVYRLSDGIAIEGEPPTVFDDRRSVYSDDNTLRVSGGDVAPRKMVVKDRRGRPRTVFRSVRQDLGSYRLADQLPNRVFIMAGNQLYTGGNGKVAAVELGENTKAGTTLQPTWTGQISGNPADMLAGDDRLFVITDDARLYCFGRDKVAAPHPQIGQSAISTPSIASIAKNQLNSNDSSPLLWRDKAQEILGAGKRTGVGFALCWGVGTGQLVENLLDQSKLHIVVVDPDKKKIETFRRRMHKRGLYGWRVAAIAADPTTFVFPKYLANLIVSEDIYAVGFEDRQNFAKAIFKPLRPYGGLACLPFSDEQHQRFIEHLAATEIEGAVVRRSGNNTILLRDGALPESDDWTHQYGNAAQTVVSKDKRVKAPVGVLWFGGPSHAGILPRHGHGPSPQVAGGRLLIEGPDMLRAVDVYTGRVMWERQLKEFGKYYNTTKHFPGAGEIGSNYVTLSDAVYAVYGPEILKLDAATGDLIKSFRLAADPNSVAPNFGHISVSGDFLVATADPLDASAKSGKTLETTRYASGSQRLVVFDRHSGKQLWQREATFNFRHNNIAVAAGRVYCLDIMTNAKRQTLARRGIKLDGTPMLYALDVRTGKILWSTSKRVFGTFLNYSEEHDTLVQAGSAYRDRARDEVTQGIIAYRGSDGTVLWDRSELKHGGPCLLWKDKIITNGLGGFALDMKTGQPTGWKYHRMYGCNTAIGSEHLLTFRSGAAGFYDLDGDSGTGNFGGFKSSCTNNLIVANGVLNAPDYTRTCTCAYQNQTSLAMIHMPEAEFWTFGGIDREGRRGLNFAAPGNRRSPDGTLWVAKQNAKIEPANPTVFRIHSSFVVDGPLKWVAASGFKAVTKITVPVKTGKSYLVNLHFLEPENLGRGDRVFDVTLQGKTELTDFDLVLQAGGSRRAIVKQFEITATDGQIVVEFSSKTDRPAVISGVEIVMQ